MLSDLEVRLITGQYAGETVFIPRIPNQPLDKETPSSLQESNFLLGFALP